MFLIIWQYRVKASQEKCFVEIYGADGRWAEFFREHSGYQGTVLVKSSTEPRTYVTLDYWDSEGDYIEFVEKNRTQYESIDRECEELTESEKKLGEYGTP